MASTGLKRVIGVFVAGSLAMSSTAAMASTAGASPQANPWAVLTAMSGGAPAAAMCGAAAATAAAAQGPTGCVLPVMDAVPPPPPQAPPPPPLPVEAAAGGISPLILGLLAVAAGVGIYLAVHNSGGHGNSPA
jgi:hypothetical protein